MGSTSDDLPGSSNPEEDSNLKPLQSNTLHTLTSIVRKCVNGLTVEPMLFLAMFGNTMSSIILTNLLLIRSCEYMKLENCTSMDSHSGGPVEKIVQPYVAQLGMFKSIEESIVPAVMAFFVGPWSDVYGRKPLLFCSLLGYCLSYILLIAFTWFELAPLFLLATSAPLVLLGGSMTFYTGSFCYLNDICPTKDLPLRMAFAEAMLFLGLLSGNAAVPYIYALFPSHGFEGIFAISFVLCFCAMLYVTLLVPESITNAEWQHNCRAPLKAIFDYRHVLGLFKVCFGHFDGFSRYIRLTMVIVSVMGLIPLEGTAAVSFLFVRNKFSWDLKDFSTWTDASLLIAVCGLFFGTLLFSKWCKLPNEPLSSLACLMRGVSYLIAGLGSYSWCLYVSSGVGALGGMSSPLNRAILSNTVPKRDMGKLLAFISALCAVVPILASITYIPLYNSTMTNFPGAVYLFSAALSFICCILTGSVIIYNRIYNLAGNRQIEDDSNQDLLHHDLNS